MSLYGERYVAPICAMCVALSGKANDEELMMVFVHEVERVCHRFSSFDHHVPKGGGWRSWFVTQTGFQFQREKKFLELGGKKKLRKEQKNKSAS
jgi:hypothetical protein